MKKVFYSVRATCRDEAQRAAYLAWLVPHHTEAMIAHGALTATVCSLETGDPAAGPAVEAHYTYPSREAFDAYVRDHAPKLRGDSQKHFPPDCGITFERRLGEVAWASCP